MGSAARYQSIQVNRREFAFGDEDFEALRRLVKQLSGINLTEQKRELVYGRLSRRLRALNLSSFREYRQLLGGGLRAPASQAELQLVTAAAGEK